MLHEIEDTRRDRRWQERKASPSGREIMTDIAITTAGVGMVILAVLLAAHGVFLR
jgi:hypothetical protein